VDNAHIHGPKGCTECWIEDRYIYGPRETPLDLTRLPTALGPRPPTLVVAAGDRVGMRFLEFFAATIRDTCLGDACLSGSVSARAGRYSWLDEGRDFSRSFQHTQNRCGAAKEVEPTVVGGHLLIGSESGTEKVT
jgi:hypothetical protein